MAGLTTAYSVIKNQPDMDIGNVPMWHSFDVTVGLGVDCTEDIPLLALPIRSIIHDFVLSCVLQDTGATTVAGTLMLDTLAVDLHTETADNLGATGVPEVEEIDNVENFPLAAADELRLLITTAGTSTTPPAIARVSVLVSRLNR